MADTHSARAVDWDHAVRGGVVAGVLAGIAIAVFLSAIGALEGHNFWVGIKAAAYPLLGAPALEPGFANGPVLLGLFCHFSVSILWGVGFALVAYGLAPGGTLALGALWGLIVWVGMYYVVLPAVGARELVRDVPLLQAIASHLIFGLAVAAGFLPYQHTHDGGRPFWQERLASAR